MNSIVMLILGVAGMLSGYFFYSKFIASKVFKLDPNFKTPAHEFNDGVDYVPTNKFVLWGHHFTSVAGAAPIVGPAIAVFWGWLPAFLWVVLGTIFMAGVHDMAAIWASTRNKGHSMATIVGNLIGPRARVLLLVVIFLLLLMVNTAFGTVIGRMMVNTPSSVLPVWGALVVAFIIGQCIYRFKLSLPIVSLLGVIALYLLIYMGPMFPIELPKEMLGLNDVAWWIIILFVYAAIASILPVWMLLQPRDYINGLQLFVGLIVLYASVIIVSPDVVAPAFNENEAAYSAPIMPLLFVTIACGAISGFHGLVSTGTTSKQVNKETDIRFVGYLGAMGEGLLALVAIIATTAGFATLTEWEAVYSDFGKGGITAFINGGASIMERGVGLSSELSATMLTVMAALFAGTTMDTGVRLQRYILQEVGEAYRLPVLTKGSVATLLAVGICVLLVFGTGGSDGSGGLTIWPLFGTTNQLMAGLTLLIVTVILLRRGIKSWYTLLPMAFLLTMTVIALFFELQRYFVNEQWLLFVLGAIILISAIMVTLECAHVLRKEWPKGKVANLRDVE
ncbi:carbon starvation CstA family protein [Basilea psittacipulmonis]|uniref:Carbon starvation protein CstA n=1 Tax=Basilea psittacipulmonis DSM 24701 TaxID=1072685 RepID=A0A077DDT8_9BURK|nr:carbon starvation protein A [Basilea psittacipulmonis]AIL32774.1 carbon starvation protein CstA [Basilea psittacipulmonis DSM 24701]